VLLGCSGDLDGEFQGNDDERLASIGANDQQVGAVEPFVELAKSIAAALHFDTAIRTEYRHRHVATEATARGARERNALGSEATPLQ
jgi:hypothetical protein